MIVAGVLLAVFVGSGCNGTAPAPEDDPPREAAPAADAATEEPAPEAAEENEEASPENEDEDAASTGEKDPAPTANAAPEIQAAYWLNTDPLSLEGLRGKIVVVEFWATWCPPCRTTIPHLIEMYEGYKEERVAFVSLTNEPRGTVEPFVEKMNMPYPVGGGSNSARAYGVRGIPRAFILDPSGRIVWEGHPMGGLEEALEKQLETTPPTK
jgi:thiol-disulfide isomerase/thioredoxin